MINGHTVQQSQVQNMFHSVQLNVNNPHFLIMQGRITKVLSMKPVETLSMIEEAAGTRMFEDKKQAAQKTIMKKQMKVDEITKCMEEEITPTLDGLRTERQDYHTWQSNNTEFERLDRFCIAYDYKVAEERVLSSEEDKKALEHEHEQYMSLIEQKKALASEWVSAPCSEHVYAVYTIYTLYIRYIRYTRYTRYTRYHTIPHYTHYTHDTHDTHYTHYTPLQ